MLLAAALLLTTPAVAQSTERVSVSSAGLEGISDSDRPAISADGRHVAFASLASNLVSNDTNGADDCFVHDRQTGQTVRISVDSAGLQCNGESSHPAISADGRFVAFVSAGTNLVPGDSNGRRDVFVHDRHTGQTRRVSVSTAGAQGNADSELPSISADGRFVAFSGAASTLVAGDTNLHEDVFVHDLLTGRTSRISADSFGVQGNDHSRTPSLSADGRIVAFASQASNLVPADTNHQMDVFVHDRSTALTSRVSVSSLGTQSHGSGNDLSISADGRFVVFESSATNLVSGDTNGYQDVFVHDRGTLQTSRVSVNSAGVQGNGRSNSRSISADGRFVAFASYAPNLVPGDANGHRDAFVHDRWQSQTFRVSVSSAGGEGNDASWLPSISADGKCIAFLSAARNLVPGDRNLVNDAFVRDRTSAQFLLTSTGSCPGSISLTVSHASPAGKVAIACGAAGSFVKTASPCPGIMLGILPPALTVILTADASGRAVLDLSAPGSLCGRSVQAVDLTTCSATNVLVL